MVNFDPVLLTRLGRHGDEKECSLWWSGSGVRFEAACGVLRVEAECAGKEFSPWLGVLVDGVPVARLPLMPGRHAYPVLSGMDRTVTHEITLLRDTQPTTEEATPLILHSLETDGELRPASPKPCLIEFIGDSLTVGEGCAGPQSGQEWRMVYISHMGSFPMLVSRMMNAEERVIAAGGWGAWRSYDDHPEHVLGRLYEGLCPLIASGNKPYTFHEREADAVVINLGTNDSGPYSRAADQAMAGEAFVKAAQALINQVRARQKKARIIWAYGLCGTTMAPLIERAVGEYRAKGDEGVFFLPLTDCAGDLGSRSHPSRAAHQRAAREIAAALKNFLDR